MEMFLPAYRGVAGAMLEVFWGIAVMLVAPIAYLLQNWRYIQLAISLPSVLAIAYIWWATKKWIDNKFDKRDIFSNAWKSL